jgi:DNA-binding IclR family transcriptional regulator
VGSSNPREHLTRSTPARSAAMTSSLRCLQVLELMADPPFEVSVSDVAQQLSTPKASAHRLLGTLLRAGFVEQESVTRRYRLAGKTLWLGTGYLRNSDVYRASFLSMQELAKNTQGAVRLGVWDEDTVLVLYSAGYATTMQMFFDVGDRRPVHASAMGKAMLAFRPPSEARRIFARSLEAWTHKTITTLSGMKPELEKIRKAGYAVSDEELIPGIRALAAPIRDEHGQVAAAVSVADTPAILKGRLEAQYAGMLKDAAAKISAYLGFRAGVA